VLLPERIYAAFATRKSGERASPAQLEAMGYPRLPEDDELREANLELRQAAAAGDTRRVAEVHMRIEALELQREDARRAMQMWQAADSVELEKQIAQELATAPHADVLLGIPVQARRTLR
jgi:hypothetical protein